MSIFRPHKTKPRQFNYTPRFYDPVKEALNQRRRELHGTSSDRDDVPYSPGDYLRMKREARRESHESQSKSASNRLLRYGVLIAVVGLGVAYLMPRVVGILTRFMGAGEATEVVASDGEVMATDSTASHEFTYVQTDAINYEADELDPDLEQKLAEVEAFNRQTRSVTIYSDDVEIVDGKVVDQSEK